MSPYASRLMIIPDHAYFAQSFKSCTKPLGPLRQLLYSCLTCNPPPEDPHASYSPAGVCYSCSVSCHGEHELVELFHKRNFTCDCGTTRLSSSSVCTLRENTKTGGYGGVHSERAADGNAYNQNFRNRFCGCERIYDAHSQRGTMYQCIGLGTTEDGGCGEDWWHPACIVGLGPEWHESFKGGPANGSKNQGNRVPEAEVDAPAPTENHPDGSEGEEDDVLPPGFPNEDDFEFFVCYKCTEANLWIKKYAGTKGFLPAVFNAPAAGKGTAEAESQNRVWPTPSSNKRKSECEADVEYGTQTKKSRKDGEISDGPATESLPARSGPAYHTTLPPAPTGLFSLCLKEDFRDHLCKCSDCFPYLSRNPQLLEEEDCYEPPLSVSDDGGAAEGSSTGTASLLDRGERALSNLDRVRAIEGVMAYNKLKEKVKTFLKPFADSGQAVAAEDVKKYFEQLRGDADAMREAVKNAAENGGPIDGDGDSRRDQSGECLAWIA